MINESEHHHDIQSSLEIPTGPQALKEYRAPRLRDLGKLSELTQAGGTTVATSDGASTYAPVSS